MRTVIGVLVAVGITLFCLSLLRAVVLFLEVPVLAVHGFWYNAQGLVTAPGSTLPSIPFIASLLFTALVVALLIGWIRRREGQAAEHHAPNPVPPDDLASLARDLDRTARRLEERIDALETILLDQSKSRL